MSAPAGIAAVCVHRRDIADAARNHDGLVIAADFSGNTLLERAEIPARLGRPNSLLNAAPPIGP